MSKRSRRALGSETRSSVSPRYCQLRDLLLAHEDEGERATHACR